mgnify:CR=1 FL=1
MKSKKILITGCAGFIGFHTVKLFLIKNYKVVGIDDLNKYYDSKLKIKRLNILKKFNNFKFCKADINNRNQLKKIFNTKFDIVIHLAAQAGVRYSITNPYEYFSTNLLGFCNILQLSKEKKISKFIYASSSSVYGEKNMIPFSEDNSDADNPIQLYAATKRSNEIIAKSYNNLFNMNLIGLRFFTVYGEWGRPDMFLMKYLTSSFDRTKKFYLNNFGNHTRDFTYILDACEIIEKLLFSKKKQRKHQIFNICSNNPIKLLNIVSELNKLTTKKPKIYRRKLQEADVIKTHGSNKKISSIIGNKKFIPIKNGLLNTLNWFKQYYNY